MLDLIIIFMNVIILLPTFFDRVYQLFEQTYLDSSGLCQFLIMTIFDVHFSGYQK
jgi:hypothetical protein